jgi:hypothetical protein
MRVSAANTSVKAFGSFDVAAVVLLFFVGQVLWSHRSFGIGLGDRPY